MGVENLKKGIEKGARAAVTGLALLSPLQGNKVEAAEEPPASWEANVTEMHQLAVNESNEFRRIIAVGTDGTIRFSPLKEGTSFTSSTSESEVKAFTQEASRDIQIKSLGLEHTHPEFDMNYYTKLPKSSWEGKPLIPPSDIDVGLKSTADLAKEFAKAGIPAKSVCLFVADPSGGIWYYQHKRTDELHSERERTREKEEPSAVQLERKIKDFRRDFNNRPTWKNADLNHIASFLPTEEQAVLHAPENASKDFGALVRGLVDHHIQKQIESAGNPNNPIVALIAPAEGWRQDYANLIKEARLLRTSLEERAQAREIMTQFAGASVSASFDFTKEYAKLQEAYELINGKARYVSPDEVVREGPCVGVDASAKKVAGR